MTLLLGAGEGGAHAISVAEYGRPNEGDCYYNTSKNMTSVMPNV